ncbi:MAG: YrbL family protein [Pseudomonadota bacterium]|nr:YrbL family protein [Pseudomonadota bacterium]
MSADFPNQVLKVPHTSLSGKTLKKPVKKFFKNILFKYYPKASHSFVRREIKESEKCLKLEKIIKKKPPISIYLGKLETTVGVAYIYTKACNESGEVGLNFSEAREKLGDLICLKLLNELVKEIFDWKIICHEFTLLNIVLEETEESKRFILVDGFGDPYPIPLYSLSSSLNRYLMKKKIKNNSRRFPYIWNDKTNLFEQKTI